MQITMSLGDKSFTNCSVLMTTIDNMVIGRSCYCPMNEVLKDNLFFYGFEALLFQIVGTLLVLVIASNDNMEEFMLMIRMV